ncbi:ankyrin repeat and SOCS box protein 12 [Rhinatrema bivittatum]|uniref:ankyrin repeat and SOCS box protein 12 n=1 Tax=Rhinatrema bivittatum TaxID=194408 RepID=UPI00112E0F76|nr:ankyrin repeat and SOCS box protein 12 [Rhinatrema bivittatum]XP_029463559.1 ankyrin repeat and SOCS box protein 12 [Rhinatrema bivittatum]XP_029463560.1 ankyrin repeat and SOCS box protein 12 [Rhinatrema bivittatum]
MKMVHTKQNKMSLVDIKKIFSMLQPRDDDEDNGERQELHQAVSNNDAKVLALLLSQERYKAFINSRSGWGIPGTPLRLAATQGHLQSLEVLLDHGAEVDSLDVKAQTPLFTAVSTGHLDCVKALLKAGANPNGSVYNNCSPVLTASREGNEDILRELLEHGAEVNVRSKTPEWASNNPACTGPLYLSAVYGHLECFRMLLLYGADPNYNCIDSKLLARIRQPKTVLEMCLKHGCTTQFIKLLLEFGANVYLPNLGDEAFSNHEAMQLLRRERVHPRSLLSETRLAIRKSLKRRNQIQGIDQLKVPLLLISYLKYQT